ncbi:MAG: TIR domain-containing protein, partial [Nitrospiraceae bacterium]|nr:TIR domain-containing protein [Nitrospiraceae bacterium]
MHRVFISYSHDSPDHKARVHALASRLNSDGVTVICDKDCSVGGPEEQWDKWSEMQAQNTEIVLIVFSESYRRCWDGEQPPGIRRGATNEARVIFGRIYKAGNKINFCRVVVFDQADKEYIPDIISGLHIFNGNRDYSDLLQWLRNVGAAPDPLAHC